MAVAINSVLKTKASERKTKASESPKKNIFGKIYCRLRALSPSGLPGGFAVYAFVSSAFVTSAFIVMALGTPAPVYAHGHTQIQTPPITVEPETLQSSFRTDTFIPDFFGPGFVSVGNGQSFNFSFQIPDNEAGLYQIQVRHASNNSISILVDGTAIQPNLALNTRSLGFWFDNEAYVTLSSGQHTISFNGPVFLDTFRITRTPPDANRFLNYPTSVNEIFFAGSEENSIAYYNTIDPNGDRLTLAGFRELNGFTTDGADVYDMSNPAALEQQEALNGTDFSHAIYQNIADLDLGRRMFVLTFANGDVASYVQNFATPDNALDRRNLLATVAMEYRADERLTTFYAYDSRGQRVTKVDLDGRGQKFVPTLCAACHGGKPKDDIDGVYQNGGNIGSKWIAWDLDNFEFSSRLSLEDQESDFRSMNQAVLCTTPSVSNAELVRGWYGADSSANCSVDLPDVPFDGDFVPDGWNTTAAHRELYLDVVRPSCRSCHAQRGTYSDNTLLERKRELEFSTFEHFRLYKDEIEEHVFDQATMPSALVTYEAFWRSRGSNTDQPEILDRVLFGGNAHVSPPESVWSPTAQDVFGARRQPGRPIAEAAATTLVTTGVQGRLNALPSKFAARTEWSVTAGDGLSDLPSSESLLTVDPFGEHEVELTVSNFEGTYTDSTKVTIRTDDEQRPSSVVFDPDIKNLLQSAAGGLSCTSCHQPGGRANTVYHFSEPGDFLDGLTPEQFAYSQALTRVDCRDPDSSLLLRRPANPNHFGGALFEEGDQNWTLLRRWIAEGAPFDAERSFTEPGSDCGVLINDPDYRPAEVQSDSGIRAEHPRLITTQANTDNGNGPVWVEFADNSRQLVDSQCRGQLLNTHGFDEIVLENTALQQIPERGSNLSCDAIAELPGQLINSVPEPVQPGLDFEIREFAVIPDNTNFGFLRVKPGLIAMAHTGERLFAVEQHEGKIWEITGGVVADEPWFDVHQAFIQQTGEGISVQNLFHGGLRSVAFHPEFADNGKFYTTQMRVRPDQRDNVNYLSDTASFNVFTDSTLSEWTVDPSGNVTGHRELFRIGYSAEDHLIKQISFNPSATPGSADYGLLYIGHGDGTLGDFFGSGLNDDGLGKILRIDPLGDSEGDYGIPADNPFTSDDTWETDEVFSLGFRNPHHIAFASDGTIIVADVGRANIEEVNLISPGSNHGWPEREGSFTHLKEQGGGFLTGIAPLPADDGALGFTYPAAQYGHIGSYGNPFTGHSIAGGYVVENGSAWDGEYLFGDFVNFGDIYHTSLQGLKNAVTSGEPSSLTRSTTRRARVMFDHDNNPSTDALAYDTMLGVINDSPRYFSHSGTRRADLRFGQGPGGEIYVLNKRNNTIYLVTNTLPDGATVAAGGPTNIAPTAPGDLRLAIYSDTSAEIFWEHSVDDSFIRGYEITRNGELLDTRDALSFFEAGLDPLQTYTYAVTALDFDGNRSETVTLTFSTTGGVVVAPTSGSPTAPGNVRHLVYSDASAEIFWEHSVDDSFIRGYEITRNGELLDTRDALSFFEANLDPLQTYTYAVTAVDFDGNRSAAATVTFSTRGDVTGEQTNNSSAPTVPGGIRHQVYSGTTAEIFWERSVDDDFVRGYEVFRNDESLGIRDALSVFEAGLDPSLTYTFNVVAVDFDGNRSDAATVTFTTGGNDTTGGSTSNADNPTVPGNLRHQVYSQSAAEIFWDRSSDNGFIRGYEVVRNGVSLGIHDALGLFQEGLDPAITYNFAVTAIDTDGNRSPAALITFSTTGDNTPVAGAPTTPGNLRHQIYSQTAAEIFWDRSTDDGFVQGYEVIRNGESLGIHDSLSLFQGDLNAAIRYDYQVVAIDTNGNRSTAATLSLVTDGTTLPGSDNSEAGGADQPGAPSELTSAVYSPTAAELFWQRIPNQQLSYEIQRNGSLIAETNSVSFFDGSLNENTTYHYEIVTIDALGKRSQAASVFLTTPSSLR